MPCPPARFLATRSNDVRELFTLPCDSGVPHYREPWSLLHTHTHLTLTTRAPATHNWNTPWLVYFQQTLSDVHGLAPLPLRAAAVGSCRDPGLMLCLCSTAAFSLPCRMSAGTLMLNWTCARKSSRTQEEAVTECVEKIWGAAPD
jgi:hypothetical protein